MAASISGTGAGAGLYGVALGIGCRPDADPSALTDFVRLVLSRRDGPAPQVIATLDRRAGSAALLGLARDLTLPVAGFSADWLETMTPRLAHPSEAVFRAVGCHGVAEAAALAAAGPESVLLLEKQRAGSFTLAIAGPMSLLSLAKP